MSAFLPESARNPSVRRVVRVHPDVAGTILRHADQYGADLITLPTHGYGAIRRALRGSVTAKVLRDASCPVWATAQGLSTTPATWLKPEHILCAASTAAEGDRVLAWASRLAPPLKSQLCIAWNRRGLTEAPEQIDRVQRKFRISAETVVERESVAEALRDAVVRLRAGLLILDKSSWPAQGLSGLTSYEVVRRVPCPVISL